MNKAKIKKAGNIILNVILYVFLAICIFAVLLTVFSKRDSDGAVTVFGHQMRIVTSNSMAASEYTDVSDYEIKDIPVSSMVFIEVIPTDSAKAEEWYRNLKVGDVLTFRYVYSNQVTITHRITSITEKDDGFVIELAGDNKNSEYGQLSQTIDTSVKYNTNYIIGKVTGQSQLLGLIMAFLMQPLGLVLVIIVPCVVIIGFEIGKIAKIFSSEKKRKSREEMEKQEAELAELRQRLAELEKANGASGDGATSDKTRGEGTE